MTAPADLRVPLPDPAARGVTRISPVVVERIAAHACAGVSGTVTRVRSEVERLPAVRVRAEVMGRATHLSVTIGVEYPTPVVQTADNIRAAVGAEVERICGLSVAGIDVTAVPVVVRRASRVR